MRLVPLDDKVLRLPAVNASALWPRNLQLGESARLPLQLRLERVNMINVDVGIAHDVRKGTRDEIAHVSQHMCQQRIASNIKRHAETHVARALVQLAVQVALWLLALGLLSRLAAAGERDVKLGKHVARRQGHELEVARVPRREHHAAVIRVRAQLVDNLGELVDALAGVVGFGINVVGAKVTPLEAVDGAQVTHLAVREPDAVEELARPVAVPDLDAGLVERNRRRVALDEPQELGDDGPREDALRCQQRQDRAAVVVEAKLESRREDGERACSCAVMAGFCLR